MKSESARLNSASEARFRVAAPNSQARIVKVIALDRASETIVKRLSEGGSSQAIFLTASSFNNSDGKVASFAAWLSDLRGRTKDLIKEIESADLVIMVACGNANLEAASLIGEACNLKNVMTTSLVVGGPDISDAALSRALLQLRPWSSMLVIADCEEYVEDMLAALRA